MEKKNIFDVIIIGSGPAGMSAGVYAGRAGYKTMIIEKLSPGGQMVLASYIDNYPGFPDGISGFELQEKMVTQAKKYNVNFETKTVKAVLKQGNEFIVQTESVDFKALSVIIASGAKHRNINIPGEKEFNSRGVSYCGTCDGPFFRDKNVVVIGGGDTALCEAGFIAKFAKSVKIVHRRNRFRAVQSIVEQAEKTPGITFVFDTIATRINGSSSVESITLKNVKTGQEWDEKTDGVFVFIGLDPNTEFVDTDIMDDSQYIITDDRMKTSIPGMFAAGDVRSETFRQIICAASDGARAANYAGEYVDELKGDAY